MSHGGTKKAQEERWEEELAEVQRQLEEEGKKWDESGLPFVGSIFHLGHDQYKVLCHLQAMHKVMQDYLGVPLIVLEIETKRFWLQHMQELYPGVMQQRRDSLIARQMPENPFNGGSGIILPPGSN